MTGNDLNLHIRWNNQPDLVLSIHYTLDTIQSIKQKIKMAAPRQTDQKMLRLIYRGQLLDQDQAQLSDYGIIYQPRLFFHCALSNNTLSRSQQQQHQQGQQQSRERHHTKRLTGFDQLVESGYNEEEIRSIRFRFHQSHPDYVDGEPVSQELLELEQAWIEQNGPFIPPEGSVQGSFKEMVCGLMLGCLLGILCLFWLKESVFTRRHQMGILAGMLINVSCGVMHVYS
ncbi:DUF2407 C-terminal domain-containing protein [Choanephora cucurbitarum]|nr:DUF2407 C-terminal domain-containing protein [Choanephora cucurbitarum]